MAAPEVAVREQVGLGEAPFWDSRRQCLWFVDITGGVVHQFEPSTGEVISRPVGPPVSAVIPSLDGTLLLTQGNDVYCYDWIEETMFSVAAIDPRDPSVQLNDAASDPLGRLWAGTIDAGFARGRSSLLRFAAAAPQTVLSARGLANGIGWSPDGATMYFTDSQRRTIEAFNYDIATGSISQERLWRRFSDEDGFPDGLTVDANGDLWVAHYGAGAVGHYASDGTLVERIDFPVEKVTNMCFGGADLCDLYVTTSTYHMTPDDKQSQPLAGSTFVVPAAGSGLAGRYWDPMTIR